jgi:hypothetical protein
MEDEGEGGGRYQALGVDRMNSFKMIHGSITQVWRCQRVIRRQMTDNTIAKKKCIKSTTKKTKD